MLRLLVALIATTLVATSAQAADWAGHWVAWSGRTVMFDIHVSQTGDSVAAEWIRPSHFMLTGSGLSNVSGPVVTVPARNVRDSGQTLALTFRKPGGDEDTTFLLRLREGAAPTLELTGLPPEFAQEPFDLSRESGKPALGQWDPSATYPWTRSYPDNAEMKAMFDADQAVRQSDKIDWSKVGPEDAARLKRTRELIDAGALQSGQDFYCASFIFQHGDTSDDYLMAHVLAMAALARGYDAGWIASATLDRYLQKIGQSQVYGTQYLNKQGGWTQQPFAKALIPDSLRKVVGVPAIAAQAGRLERMNGKAN